MPRPHRSSLPSRRPLLVASALLTVAALATGWIVMGAPPSRLASGSVLPAATGSSAPVGGTSTSPPGTSPTSTSPTGKPSPSGPAEGPSAEPPSRARRASIRPLAGDGKPRVATVSIPALGIKDLRIEPHRGAPDDARGTRLQDRGIAASPYGPRGGVGPGGVGNYIVTAHRLSSTQAFRHLPKVRVGDKVYVKAGGQRYTYRIQRTRITSFRSATSLAAQRAAVPGRPGVRATKAMITLSTCRTPEDRAEGNYWSDRFGNPENRIDKIGVLIGVRPA